MHTFAIEDVQDVLWTTTFRCNLNCIYCSVGAGAGYKPQPELTCNQIDQVLNQLDRLPSLQSVILSGGEFLLAPQRDYILAEFRRRSKHIYVITNGTYITQPILDSLQTYRPTLMVSVDSTQEAINAKTRGVGMLARAGENVLRYLTAGLELVLIAVITRYNIGHIVEDLIYWHGLGVRNVLLQQLHAAGRANPLFRELSPEPSLIMCLYEELQAFERYHSDMQLDYNEICLFPKRPDYFQAKCKTGLLYRPQRIFMCGAGYNFFALKMNGDLIPCNAMQEHVFGNIFQEDLLESLANSPQMQAMRNWRNHRVDEIPGCANCPYNPVCDGGCRADVLNSDATLLTRHPYCHLQPDSAPASFGGIAI